VGYISNPSKTTVPFTALYNFFLFRALYHFRFLAAIKTWTLNKFWFARPEGIPKIVRIIYHIWALMPLFQSA
jgi:hypothetical protein